MNQRKKGMDRKTTGRTWDTGTGSKIQRMNQRKMGMDRKTTGRTWDTGTGSKIQRMNQRKMGMDRKTTGRTWDTRTGSKIQRMNQRKMGMDRKTTGRTWDTGTGSKIQRMNQRKKGMDRKTTGRTWDTGTGSKIQRMNQRKKGMDRKTTGRTWDTGTGSKIQRMNQRKMGMHRKTMGRSKQSEKGGMGSGITVTMAVRFVSGPGQLVICPYDANHIIRAEKYAMHLYKCKKNYHGTTLARCTFSACHRMPEDELHRHEMSCPYATADPKDPPTIFTAADACCVCLTQQATHVFTPCGHKCVGDRCGQYLRETTSPCPICRRIFVAIVVSWLF
ncbi:GTSF1 [Branchiostoma lanceolatum]|uniref:GTSF1 protein n=1 Tax=Branchiostoma lanceolatum TaxID=7740 RepID=A0A8J9W0V4_BRALA|nr:GTSF1 [Branchiostoma lanceolatum]